MSDYRENQLDRCKAAFVDLSKEDREYFVEIAAIMIGIKPQPTIADFFADDDVKKMIEKTKCGVVTIASLKKFGGLE